MVEVTSLKILYTKLIQILSLWDQDYVHRGTFMLEQEMVPKLLSQAPKSTIAYNVYV